MTDVFGDVFACGLDTRQIVISSVWFCVNTPANVDTNLCFWHPVLIIFLVPQLREWGFAN